MIDEVTQKKDTTKQFHGLAVDIVNCHKYDCDEHFDPHVEEKDVPDCRGLREVSIDDWPQPVFVVYETANKTLYIDVDASTRKQLTHVRQAIEELGLEELACFEYESKHNHDYDKVDDEYLANMRKNKHNYEDIDEDHLYYEWEYKYAVVLQVPLSLDPRERDARHRKAASELAKLVWQEGPTLDEKTDEQEAESAEERRPCDTEKAPHFPNRTVAAIASRYGVVQSDLAYEVARLSDLVQELQDVLNKTCTVSH